MVNWDKKVVKRTSVAEASTPMRSEFSERLTWLIAQYDSRPEAAKVAGVSPEQLPRYKKGQKVSFDVVTKLAIEKGVSLDWLATGNGSPRPGEDAAIAAFVQLVPVWDVVASSGPGSYHISDELRGEMGFSRAWLLTLGIPLNDLHVVFNSGDSNAPSINDRDAMLIQRGIERLEGDAFYVFDSGDVLLVKQLERRADGSVVLRSRNPAYEPQIVPRGDVPALMIFGKVVWAGGVV